MNAKVDLDTIVGELDFLSEEYSSFLNKQTGEVVHIAHEDMRRVEGEEDEENNQDGNAEDSEDTEPDWHAEASQPRGPSLPMIKAFTFPCRPSPTSTSIPSWKISALP